MTTNGDMTVWDELAVLEDTFRVLSALGLQGPAFAAAQNAVAEVRARHPAPDRVADAVRDRANYQHTNGEAHA